MHFTESIVAPVQNLGIGSKEGIKLKDNEQFRICYHCSGMLERRRTVQAEQMMQPIISQLYAHLQKMKSQVQSMVDLYNKVCEINSETRYPDSMVKENKLQCFFKNRVLILILITMILVNNTIHTILRQH